MFYHIVKVNENLDQIAKMYNLKIDELKEDNLHIKNWQKLIPGTKLKIKELTKELNEILDNVEPFIEDYYPKIEDIKEEDFKDYNDSEPPSENLLEKEVTFLDNNDSMNDFNSYKGFTQTINIPSYDNQYTPYNDIYQYGVFPQRKIIK